MKLLLLTVLSIVSSLDYFGHFIIANIAENYLKQVNPEVYAKASKVALAMNALCDKNSQTFIESSAWADDIKKSKTAGIFDRFHHFDSPINTQGLLIE